MQGLLAWAVFALNDSARSQSRQLRASLVALEDLHQKMEQKNVAPDPGHWDLATELPLMRTEMDKVTRIR